MSPLYLLLFLPAIGAIGWALWKKVSDHKYLECIEIGIPAVAAIVNVICVYLMMAGIHSLHLKWVQMVLGCTIVPLAYMYFSRQIGRQRDNTTTIMLWTMMLFLLLPNAYICWPMGSTPQEGLEGIRPYAFHFIRKERVVLAVLTGDFVVVMQALLTMLRIVPMVRALKRNGLKFTPKVYCFGVWWVSAIFFIIAVSSVTLSDLATPAGAWFYFAGFALLMTMIYMLFALRFDLHPIQTEEGEVVTHLDRFIENQSAAMAQRVRAIVEDEKVYMQPGFTTDDMLGRLHTNRTYFTQMMTAEFGMTFSEYLNTHRLARVMELIEDKNLQMTEIAEQSGYSDANYMARKFKEKYGVSPSRWRNRND